MDSAEALLSTAIAGLGVVTLPDYLVWQDIRSGKLVPVLEDFAETPTPIRVVYPSKKHLSPKIRQLIDLLIESWSPKAPWELD
ncbi:DNA-binding transcriptional activator GcvA [compost metagenome]